MSAGVPIATPEPDPFRKDSVEFWREQGKELARGSLKTLDKVGEQLITVAGVLAGLYTNAVAFGDLRKAPVTGAAQFVYLLPIVLLLLSLVCALMIFMPDRYKVDLRAIEAIQLAYRRAVSGKLLALRLAALFLVLGVAAIALALGMYLR